MKLVVLPIGYYDGYDRKLSNSGRALIHGQPAPVVGRVAMNMTMLDVMIVVGGLTDFASGNAATILRTSEGSKQYSVRLKDLIKRGDMSANVEMKPGDILIIPQSFF